MRDTLYPYQRTHLDTLLQKLKDNLVAIDASVTGAGKTIVATNVIYRMLVTEHKVTRVVILAPPILLPQWRKAVESLCDEPPSESTDLVDLDRQLRIQHANIYVCSCYSMHKVKGNMSEALLVADEFHLFKNLNKRSVTFTRLVTDSQYALLLSATPYDDKRQLQGSLLRFLPINKTVEQLMSRMDFTYKNPVLYAFAIVELNEELMTEYVAGYRLITCSSRVLDEAGHPSFNPKMYGKGFRLIHNSLIDGCLRYVSHQLSRQTIPKIIVVLFFQEHFRLLEELCQHMGVSYGAINGSTSTAERSVLMSRFNSATHSISVLGISSDVGGIGIELDDKVGKLPREMVMLPVANGISFIQAVGRIQRSNTKSMSKVTVIQPRRRFTFFRRYIGKKFKDMEAFCTLPLFSVKVETHRCELKHMSKQWLNVPEPACSLITDYLCSCRDMSKYY